MSLFWEQEKETDNKYNKYAKYLVFEIMNAIFKSRASKAV